MHITLLVHKGINPIKGAKFVGWVIAAIPPSLRIS
nr:MAG TPA: hypothetical protein [Caudoviricetes sp.]